MNKGRYALALLFFICFLFFSVAGCVRADTGKNLIKKNDTEEVALKTVTPPQSNNQDLSLLPQDIKQIKERGRIVVAMYWQDRPPFFYKNVQGQLVGIDVNLARDIAKWLDVDVEFDREAKSFDQVVDRVVSGHADIGISKLSVTLSRAQRALYTDPYVIFHQALLVNRLALTALKSKAPNQESLALITDSSIKIGVRKGTSYEEYAKIMFPNSEIVVFSELTEIMEAVREGKVVAAFYDEFELKTQIYKNPELSIYAKLFILKDSVDLIAMVVAPGNSQLHSWLNTYLKFRENYLSIPHELEEYSGGIDAAN